jgi:hypothetical protein
MPSLTQAIVLKHQSNLGEGVAEVAFSAGTPVTILKEWQQSYLVKSAAGQLFNVPKELVQR